MGSDIQPERGSAVQDLIAILEGFKAEALRQAEQTMNSIEQAEWNGRASAYGNAIEVVKRNSITLGAPFPEGALGEGERG